MHDSELLKALIVDTFGVDVRYLELYARALKRETEPAVPSPSVSADEQHPDQSVSPVMKGRGGAEKQSIFAQLQEYRKRNGLGSLRKLVAGRELIITEDDLRQMLAGAPYPLDKWREVKAALDATK